MLYLLYRLYGRTVIILLALLVNLHRLLKIFYHILGGRGSVYHVLGGIHDALRDVGRVYHRPLCACPADCKQAQADNKCYSCSHVTLDISGYRYCSLIGWSGFGFTRT